MLNHFTFNGHSTGELGLLVSGINIYGSPSRIVEKVTIPYRSGDLLIDTGAYTNYMLTYTVDIMDNTKATAEAISKWLLGSKGYCELTDTYNPEIYRVASYYNQLDYTLSALYRYGKATITFDCKPQKYLTANQPVTLSPTTSEATSYSLSSPAMPLPLTLEGNTTQNTLSGKNLLPTGLATKTNHGVTATRQTDGSYLLSGTSDIANDDIYILSGEEYYFTMPTASAYRVMQPTTSGIQLWLAIKRAASGNTVYNNSTFPMNAGDLVIGVFIRVATSGTNTNGIKVYPQIELGSTSTTYEQYCGGIPSPNPDYPQEIHSVSGDNEIRVVGFNVWDEEWEVGTIGNTGENYNATDRIRSKNYIPVIPNATYYYWINSTYGIYTWGYDANKNYVGRIPSNGFAISKSTVTIPADVHYIRFVVQAGYGTVYKHDICINVSSSRNGEYEPYKAQVYPINLPVQNLYNAGALTQGTTNGITLTVSGGTLTFNGTATATTYYTIYNTGYSNRTYTFSYNNSTVNSGVRISFMDAGGTYYGDIPADTVNKTGTVTCSPNNLVLYINSGTTLTNFKITPQLEVGSKANSYTPYGVAPIELNGLSTFKDYIHKENGKWWVHKATNKATLTGSNSEGWQLNSSGTYTKYQWSAALPDKYNVVNTSICSNYFTQITVSQGDAKNVIGIAYGVYPSYSLQIVSSISTLAEWKTWLSTHNTDVIYPLATPTETEITDATLISQLNALSKAKTYDGATNIVQDGNDAEFTIKLPVPAEISSEYFGEPIITVNEVGTIVWNDSLIKVNSAPVTINSQTLQCYYYSENKNNDVEINDFPKYEQGENYIGSTMALTVVPNYWKL